MTPDCARAGTDWPDNCETDEFDRRVTRDPRDQERRATSEGGPRRQRVKLLADMLRELDVNELRVLDEASTVLGRLFSVGRRN